VITSTFADFFFASAGAAAALIGLLFVAVSIAVGRAEDTEVQTGLQVRAAAALLTFTNVLTTSLVSLIPDTNPGWPATVVGSVGLLFALASLQTLIRSRGADKRESRGLLAVLFVLFGLEVFYGVRALADPGDTGAISGIAAVMVGSLGVGVARSWDLVGLDSGGILSSIRLLFGPKPER
jgi:hypothetical protein